ncbi:uncharacterized protein LOC142487971 isoform X2 [Ascaphus truei]|uniref:uncharacterized protein LOC142487971 isoform X2 n=1 Tax=Ascaphus truei TaxID=8439 RepID=UPI003F5977F9
MSEGDCQITFDDAAIYFSEEQWKNLEENQKQVYKDLIKEIYETMVALGYQIPKPEIVCLIERGEDPCPLYSKKRKLQGSQPAGLLVGGKDPEPVIKTEPGQVTYEPFNPLRPGDISSTQERSSNGLQCQACGTYCNNQCQMSFHWETQRLYHLSPTEGSQGKQYVSTPPQYYSGNVAPPRYANGSAGIRQATPPVASYGHVGGGPLTPHSAGYRSSGDPNSPFTMPERSGNSMSNSFENKQSAAPGPVGSNTGSAEPGNQSRREQYPCGNSQPQRTSDTSFQDRRNIGVPCQACGTFCNNQCRMSCQWDQQRLHHAAPGAIEGNQRNSYTSPPNPYFNGSVTSPHHSNGRQGIRPTTSPVSPHGNLGMGQLSPLYAGYRRPSDPNLPNTMNGRSDNTAGNAIIGSNAGYSSTHCANQVNKSGTLPVTNSGNQRMRQTMPPLAALETMPMFTANGSPSSVNDQRIRHSAPIVTSSDGYRDKSGMHPNNIKRQDAWHYSNQGNGRVARGLQPFSQPQAIIGQTGHQKSWETINDKSPSTTVTIQNGHIVKHAMSSGAAVSGQEAWRAGTSANFSNNYVVKRATPPITQNSNQAVKQASPPVNIVEHRGEKRASPSSNTGNGQFTARATPPTAREGRLDTPPVTVSGVGFPTSRSQSIGRATPPDAKSGNQTRRTTPPVTISSIQVAGLSVPPDVKVVNRESKHPSSPIIIIDDKENKQSNPPSLSTPVANIKSNGSTPAAPSLRNIQGQGVPPGGPVLVNKLQMQQSSPIIVTGNPGLGGASLPVAVNGNQSFMLTFPVTVGSSGIMLATPMNIAESPVTGVNQAKNLLLSKNPRLLQTNTVPTGTKPGNGNAKIASVTMTSIIGQTNSIPMTIQSGQANPVTVNVNQTARIAGSLNVNNTNLGKVNSSAIKAVPVTSGSQTMQQTIFVDANSRFFLTTPSIASKDNVPSGRVGMGNATVVTVNGGVVTGNGAPVALSRNLQFRNIAPVNVNRGLAIGHPVPINGGLRNGNTTIFTIDGAFSMGKGTPVTLAGNATAHGGKGALGINNSAIVACESLNGNGGLGIVNAGPVTAPVWKIPSADVNGHTHVGQTCCTNIRSLPDHQSAGVVVRKASEPSALCKIQQTLSNTAKSTLTVERLFKCSQCAESFSSPESLSSHQRIHEAVKSSAENNGCDLRGKEPSETEDLSGATDGDSPTILYTTQGDDGSTVYVVTV